VKDTHRPGRINLKALVILFSVMVLLMAAAYAGWKVRKRIIADRALVAGKAAVAAEDWVEACKQLRQYVVRYPDNVEVLKLYAEANLRVQPLEPAYFWQAVGCYRRLIRDVPDEAENYEELAKLYRGIGEFSELTYVADKWRQIMPEDLRATVWLARGLMPQRKFEEAREALMGIIDKDKPEVVDALLLLSDIELAGDDDEKTRAVNAMKRLNECVNRFPDLAKPLAVRARTRRVWREHLKTPDDGPNVLKKAWRDLEKASSLATSNPTISILLFAEWMDHGELDRAEAELNAAKSADAETLRRHDFEDLDSWQLVLFRAEAQLDLTANRPGAGVDLADRALVEFGSPDSPQRILFLPDVARLYIAGGRAGDAEAVLEEYQRALVKHKGGLDDEDRLLIQSLRGRIAVASGRPYDAANELEPYLARQPGDAQAWRMLSWAYEQTRQLRRFTRALERYVELTADRSPDLPAVLRLARRCIQERDWESAERYARLLQSHPEYATAGAIVRVQADWLRPTNQTGGADVPWSSQRLATLRSELELLRQSDPDRVDIRLMIAATYLQEKRTDEAINELKRATKECSEPLDAYLQLARWLVPTERLDEAIELMREALDQYPDVSAPWVALSELLERAERVDEARQTLRQAEAAMEPGSRGRREVVRAMANLEMRQDNRQAGIAVLEQLVSEDSPDDPTDVATRVYLLNLPEIRAEEENAQKLINEIRDIEGEAGLTWRIHQSRLWLVDEDKWRDHQQEIEQFLNHCIQADPAYEDPALLLASLYSRLERTDRVEAVYRRVVEDNPRVSRAADHLLVLLNNQRRYEEARDLYETLKAKGNVREGLGVAVAMGVREYDEAIEELERRVLADPNDVDLRIMLAGLLAGEREDIEGALAVLDEAEAVAEDPFEVAPARVAFLENAGRFADAEEVIERELARSGTFDAYNLRAGYRVRRGQDDLAEQDYRNLTTFPERAVEGYWLLGRFYLRTGRAAGAIATYEKGIETDRQNFALRKSLMGALMGSEDEGNRARGRDLLNDLLSENPDDPGLLLAKAFAVLESDDAEERDEAPDLLERAVKLDPRLVTAHELLIHLALSGNGQRESSPSLVQANALVERALRDNPHHLGLQLTKASIERRLGNAAYARQLAMGVLEREPENLRANYLVAEIAFLDLGDFDGPDGALECIDRAAGLAPAETEIHQRRAEVYAAIGDISRAVEGLEAFVTANPDRVDAKMFATLGELHRRSGNRDAAGRWLAKAEAKDPAAGEVVRARIMLLVGDAQNEGRFDELASLLAERRASAPDDAQTFFLGAGILAQSDEKRFLAQAFSLFKLACDLKPNMTAACMGAAGTAYRLNDRAGALEAFERVLELRPDHPEALNGWAWIRYEEGGDHNLAEALERVDRAVARRPNQPNFRHTRGSILLKQGKFSEARRDFRKCVELSTDFSPTRAKALLCLARVLIKLEERVEARRHLEAVLEIDRQTNCLSTDDRADLVELLKSVTNGGD